MIENQLNYPSINKYMRTLHYIRIALLSSIIYMLFAQIAHAQIPQAFSFQSLVTDSNGGPVADTDIGVKIEIHTQDVNGPIVYEERHVPTTNSNGLYSINIGMGQVLSGVFADIDWPTDGKYISLYHDLDGGMDYTFVGANQLLSVPYALAAGTSNIEPLIYAFPLQFVDMPIFNNEDNNPRFNLNYIYRWIQGTPEDVYVDIRGLPNNTHIETYSELGRFLDGNIQNFSGVDTIYDGIRLRSSRIIRTDPNQNVPAGDYEIEYTFRTSTKVFSSHTQTFRVVDNIANPLDICFVPYLGTKTMISSSCTELDTFVGSTVTIEKSNFNEEELNVTNFLEVGSFGQIIFFLSNGNCIAQAQLETYLGPFAQINDVEVRSESNQLIFDVTLMIEFEDPDNGDPPPPPVEKMCTLVYE